MNYVLLDYLQTKRMILIVIRRFQRIVLSSPIRFIRFIINFRTIRRVPRGCKRWLEAVSRRWSQHAPKRDTHRRRGGRTYARMCESCVHADARHANSARLELPAFPRDILPDGFVNSGSSAFRRCDVAFEDRKSRDAPMVGK